jgi:hypothetical protein
MFDPVRICEILNEEGVRYVIVGGIATVMHGSSLSTQDIDLVPDRSDNNLARLALALQRLNVRIRTEGESLAAKIDEHFLRNSSFMVNLVSDFGDIDIAFQPSGPLEGYAGWKEGAIELSIGTDVTVWVAALDDVVASKRAANRPKDQAALPYLETLRDQRGE